MLFKNFYCASILLFVILIINTNARIVRIEGVLPFPIDQGPSLVPTGIRNSKLKFIFIKFN